MDSGRVNKRDKIKWEEHKVQRDSEWGNKYGKRKKSK